MTLKEYISLLLKNCIILLAPHPFLPKFGFLAALHVDHELNA